MRFLCILIFFIDFSFVFVFFIPSTFWTRYRGIRGFDVAHVTVETSYGCSIVFYNHQDSHILTITDYYTSSHDLVLVFH